MTHLTESPESPHPAEDRLIAFATGDLVESELEEISEHVSQCDGCCARLASINDCDPLKDRLAKVLSDSPSKETFTRVPAGVLRWLVSSRKSDDTCESSPPPVPQHIRQYRIVREVARGGMGVVYEAMDVNLHRRVAIKMILAGEFSSSEMRIRFRREAELLAGISHTGMIQVFEIGEYRGLPFLAMEWVNGGTLAHQIKARNFDPREASELIRQLAEAVHAAHLQGIVHRDLKPSNILLSVRGPLLTDFGIAFRPEDDVRLTVSGGLSGTPEYTAPELGTGRSRLASAATDIYALGVIMYEMISGQCPFRGATGLETLRMASSDSLVPLRRHRPDVPHDLEVIVSKCLEKLPASRYSSAAALAEDVAAFLDGRPICARQSSASERVLRWCRRSPIIASLLLALVLSIAAGSTLSVWLALIAAGNATEAERLSRQSLAIAAVAREAQLRAEKAENIASERASDAMSVLLETAWNNGDAGKFLRYIQTITEGHEVAELPFEQRVLLRHLHSGHTQIQHHDGIWTASCLSPDRTRAYVGNVAGGLFAFDVETERFIQSFDANSTQLEGLVLTADQKQIVATDAHGHVVSWDLATGQMTSCVKILNGEVTSLNLLPDGRFITTGSDGTIRILSAQFEPERILRQQLAFPSADVSPDGRRIAIGSRSGDIEIVDVATLEIVGSLRGSRCFTRKLRFSHSGRFLAVAGFDGVVSLLQAEANPSVALSKQVCSGEIVSIRWSPDDSSLALSGVDQRLLLLNSETLAIDKTCLGHVGIVSGAEFCGTDNRKVMSIGFDGTLRIWEDHRNPNPERFQWSSSMMSHVDHQFLEQANRPTENEGSSIHQFRTLCGEELHCLAVSQGRRIAALGGFTGSIHIVNLSTMTLERRIETPHGEVACLKFLNDAEHLASSGDDGVVRIWNLTSAACTVELKGHHRCVRALEFDPAHQRLVSGGDDSKIILWNPDEATSAGELAGHQDKVFDLAISTDGRLYSASEDGTVRVWDLSRQAEIQKLTGHVGPVRCVAVSSDGTRAASGGWDQSVILWNCETGQQVARWEDHVGEVGELSFSRDNQSLTSLGYNGEVVRWNSSPP